MDYFNASTPTKLVVKGHLQVLYKLDLIVMQAGRTDVKLPAGNNSEEKKKMSACELCLNFLAALLQTYSRTCLHKLQGKTSRPVDASGKIL